jgi:Polysaccharide lyase
MLFNGVSTSGWFEQEAASNRIQSIADPDGASDSVLSFTADNADIAPLTPTDNPRAQMSTPTNILKSGVPFWESYEVYFPTSFPISETNGGWLALGSPFYGPPYNGTPSIEMLVDNGRYYWSTDSYAPAGSKVLWSQPVVTGVWTRFTWYVVPSAEGFVELYVNDKPIVETYNGQTGDGVSIPVIDATNYEGPWFSQMSVYYEHNEFSSVNLDFKDFAIASTQTAAES